MILAENETVEFKEIVTDDIKKEILAFANSEGGSVYIGVRDDGFVLGLEDPEESALRVNNMVRDAIRPDLTMFVRCETREIENARVLVIKVQQGTKRPYYLAKKGLRPEGVYVRQGSSSVPATDSAIRQMIKDTDGDNFESMRSLDQELTFEQTKQEFDKRNISFGEAQKKTLGLLSSDKVYTNLGLVLSDQCIHTIKVAVFEGIDQSNFKDRREFSGSILQQLNDVYEFVDVHNPIQSKFEGLQRIDSRAYSVDAIRETLLNSLVHRDYSFKASTLLSIYSDRLELVSLGGLTAGITLDDIFLGVSVCRNPKLANVFYRLGLIEAYGTGIQKIINAYKESNVKPVIEVTNNAFKVVLPNTFVKTRPNVIPEKNKTSTDLLLEYLKEYDSINRADIETLLGVSRSTANRLIRQLLEEGILVQDGKGRNTRYKLFG